MIEEVCSSTFVISKQYRGSVTLYQSKKDKCNLALLDVPQDISKHR